MLNVQAEGDGMVEGRAKSFKAQVLPDVGCVSSDPPKIEQRTKGWGVSGLRAVGFSVEVDC